jgi:hydroxymethylbilane synthase
VARALEADGHTVELMPLVTTGDRMSGGHAAAPDAVKGLFVKELEEALLGGAADLAVHSAKDLPGRPPDGLVIAAVPRRADPHDVLVGPPGGLGALPEGARVATGSPRRRAQLRAVRPDLEMIDIRGNVDTRLRKLEAGAADAIVLAAAGLARLGLDPPGATPLEVAICVPAPGQGCLAVQARADRPDVVAASAALDDTASHACLLAERALLAGLDAGCLEPVGALAVAAEETLALEAFAASAEDAPGVRARLLGELGAPDELGRRAAVAVRAAMTA